MTKHYNTFDEISNNFRGYLEKTCTSLPKTALNIMPEILTSMIHSTSCITKNISFFCKGSKFDFIQHESVDRRVRRFFNNRNYKPYEIYDSIIKNVISRYACRHSDKRVHIVFDHMFEREQFAIFMISLRVGKKSVPLWYRCFPDGHTSDEAFQEEMMKEGIKYVSDLFKDKPDYQLIFLADRWFGSASLLKFIDDLGHTYVVRCKSGNNIYFLDPKEGHTIKKKIEDFFHYKYKSTYYENVEYTNSHLITNLVYSPIKSVTITEKTENGEIDGPWILLTNGDVKRAIKDYGYRFSAIEFLFKDQKSNGFNLAKTATRNLQAFTMMYTCINIAILYLVCISTFYTRYKGKYYKDFKIKYYTIVNGKRTRKMSIFQVGLTLFQRAYNSLKYIKIPFNFILSDI